MAAGDHPRRHAWAGQRCWRWAAAASAALRLWRRWPARRSRRSLVYLAPLPLLLVGLGLGANAFGFAAAAGIAVAVAFGGFAGAGLYGGMHVIPSWLIVQQALRPRASSADGWQPIGNILATLTLLVAFVMAVTAVAARGDAGIEAGCANAAEHGRGADGAGSRRGRSAPGWSTSWHPFSWASRRSPGSPCWCSTAWSPRRRSPAASAAAGRCRDGRTCSLPAWYDWVLAGGAAVALLASGDAQFLARNVVLILLAPYFFVGLAVVHIIARRTPQPALALAAVYFVSVRVLSVRRAAGGGHRHRRAVDRPAPTADAGRRSRAPE